MLRTERMLGAFFFQVAAWGLLFVKNSGVFWAQGQSSLPLRSQGLKILLPRKQPPADLAL